MAQLLELKVPDIGGNKNVDVIEVFIKIGDKVELEQSLITLESDKATMDIPAEQAGVIKQVLVKVGSKVSAGDPIARVEVIEPAVETSASGQPVVSEQPVSQAVEADYDCDMLVLGGGPGGYSAAFRAADLGLKTIIVERYSQLGGVCLNVGCIPSKALLHNAYVIDEVAHLAVNGIEFGKPKINIEQLRGYKNKVINRLTSGLTSMAKMRNVQIVRGVGRFTDANHLEIEQTRGAGKKTNGIKQLLRFKQAIVAAGSQPVRLPGIPEDPCIVDSTGALELPFVPERMLIIGGGVIGLELGTVYSTLGARLDVVELGDGLMPGADRDLVKVWQQWNKHRFDNIMLGTKAVSIEPKTDGVWVRFEGNDAPTQTQRYDLVMFATGRAPNGKKLGLENAGVHIDERGFIPVDKQMRTNVSTIFAIGDIVGHPMLAHKGVHEGHVAAEVASGLKSHFDARVIPAVAYTDPEVAWVGITETQAKKEGIAIAKSVFPWAASGRAIANGRDEGFTKLIFDPETHQILGGGIVGPHAGDMIGEICLAIEMGCDAADIAHTIHPHPTMGESIGMAAEVFEGMCTDLPPQKKR